MTLPRLLAAGLLALLSCALGQGISYTVQVVAVSDQESALAVQRSLLDESFPAYVVRATVAQGDIYRVRVGSFANRLAALTYSQAMPDVAGVRPLPALAEGIPSGIMPLRPRLVLQYSLDRASSGAASSGAESAGEEEGDAGEAAGPPDQEGADAGTTGEAEAFDQFTGEGAPGGAPGDEPGEQAAGEPADEPGSVPADDLTEERATEASADEAAADPDAEPGDTADEDAAEGFSAEEVAGEEEAGESGAAGQGTGEENEVEEGASPAEVALIRWGDTLALRSQPDPDEQATYTVPYTRDAAVFRAWRAAPTETGALRVRNLSLWPQDWEEQSVEAREEFRVELLTELAEVLGSSRTELELLQRRPVFGPPYIVVLEHTDLALTQQTVLGVTRPDGEPSGHGPAALAMGEGSYPEANEGLLVVTSATREPDEPVAGERWSVVEDDGFFLMSIEGGTSPWRAGVGSPLWADDRHLLARRGDTLLIYEFVSEQ